VNGPVSADLPVAQAQLAIAAALRAPHEPQRVELRGALGRVLAGDVIAPLDVPAHDNAGMDGYALRGDDLAETGDTVLQVVGRGLAGHAYTGDVPPGAAVRIMTGAVLPAGCDTVAPIERCELDGERVHIAAGLRRGDNARARGEDLRAGGVALPAGRWLRPADIGLLASLGFDEVAVERRLRVALLSSGDELRPIGQPLDAGAGYDSNRYTLTAMLQRLGCDVLDLGLVADDPARIEAVLRRGCEAADVVITSGGVSSGDADYLRRAMAALGDVAFWRIAMRPGRPMAFGRIASGGRDALLFGLPGNPVAVMVTFYAFVRDALLQLMGARATPLPLWPVIALDALRKKPGRTEYQRARLQRLPDGRWGARSTGNQGSAILHSMSEADGLLVLPDELGAVAPGATVDFLPFEGLI
jgi:molybdopterin molybdotransferase